jgi:hypothetical protein
MTIPGATERGTEERRKTFSLQGFTVDAKHRGSLHVAVLDPAAFVNCDETYRSKFMQREEAVSRFGQLQLSKAEVLLLLKQ